MPIVIVPKRKSDRSSAKSKMKKNAMPKKKPMMKKKKTMKKKGY